MDPVDLPQTNINCELNYFRRFGYLEYLEKYKKEKNEAAAY